MIIFILRTSRRLRSLPWAITLGLLLGGATGNLTDRLFARPGLFRGDVVDWIQLPHWPVFNLADSAIVCGGVLAVLLAVRGHPAGRHRGRDGGAAGPAPPHQPARPTTSRGPARPSRPAHRRARPRSGGARPGQQA